LTAEIEQSSLERQRLSLETERRKKEIDEAIEEVNKEKGKLQNALEALIGEGRPLQDPISVLFLLIFTKSTFLSLVIPLMDFRLYKKEPCPSLPPLERAN